MTEIIFLVEPDDDHMTIPAYNPLKVGTLTAILRSIDNHFQLNRDELLNQLFEK